MEDKLLDNNEVLSTGNKKKKKDKKKVVAIVLTIVGILLCGAAIFLWKSGFFKKNKDVIKTDNNKYLKYQMSGNDLQDFDLQFLKIENSEANKIYSPLSIKYALAMLKEGANGKTKKQIADIVGKYSSKKYTNSENLSLANAMFIKDTYKDSVKEEYTKKINNKYNAEVLYDSFQTPDFINDWVKGKTFNLIDNLLEDVNDNDYVLVNALAIDMDWNNQIHCARGHSVPCLVNNYYIAYMHEKLDDNQDGSYGAHEYEYMSEDQFYGVFDNKNEFNGKEHIKGANVLADYNRYDIIKDLGEQKIRETVKPEYEKWLQENRGNAILDDDRFPSDVNKYLDKFVEDLKANYNKGATNTDFSLYEDKNVKSFAKDLKTYDGTTLQYVGIMPKEEKLTNYVNNVKAKDINEVIKGLKNVEIESFEEGYVTRVRGFIPFFNFNYELKLLKDLQTMGITDVFNPKKADLSNMTSSQSYIDTAVHKANIEFSNDGIKAAAATAMGGAGGTGGGFDYAFKVPVKDIDISFNKPYMFLIRDKSTGEVWFAGTVYEPVNYDGSEYQPQN